MTKEEITVLAGHRIVSPWVMKLAMDVANAEREACAKIAENYQDPFSGDAIAEDIRYRGEA